MFESEAEVGELDALMDRTFARANPHLASIVKPGRRLNARQVVRYLQGTKHVAFANPACSAAHVDGDTIGIVVHGHAQVIGQNDEGVEELEPVWRDIYGSSPFEWGEGVVFMRIRPTSMWAYAFRPEAFSE